MKKTAVIPLSLLIVSSCCPPVKEKPPVYDLVEEWKAEAPMPTVAKSAPENWWEVFQDETLNELVEEGLASSPTFQAALTRLEEAIWLADSAWADQFPTLSAQASAVRRRIPKDFRTKGKVPTGKHSTPDPEKPDPHDPFPFIRCPAPLPPATPKYKTVRSPKFFTDLLANLLVNYEVDFWGKNWLTKEAAYRRAEASQADVETTKLILVDQIASAYFSIQSDTKEIEIVEEEIFILEERLSLVESEYKAGLIDEIPILDEKDILAERKIEKQALLRSKETNTNLLAILIGREPSQFTLDLSETNWIFPVVPAGIPSQLLSQRPDIRSIEKEVEALIAEIGIAKAELLPNLTLSAGAGHEADKTNKLFKWRNRVWSLAGVFDWLLFDAGSRLAQIKAARSRFENAVANLTDQVLTSIRETEDALVAIRTQKERQQLAQQRVEWFVQSTDLLVNQFESGLVDYQEVLTSKEVPLLARREVLKESVNLQFATLALIKSLGGSW